MHSDKKGFPKTWLLKFNSLGYDLVITLLFSIFWLWFGYQYGFNNSPDSWYRGVLAKSIVEGHPYFINLKQGWLYDYGPWHHDAAHSPLLPFLYAIYFLFFGYKISIANIIVCFSAGMFIFPLLRISRRLFSTALPAFLIYFLVIFVNRSDFLFETFAGLSIPTTLMIFAFFLYFLLEILESDRWPWIWGGVLALAAFYYIRPGEQVVFFWLLLLGLPLGLKFLKQPEFWRVTKMWLWSTLLVIPWVLRKIILFRHPFFTHTTPALWTDRGYDYWTFHETMPYPTMASYFSQHSIFDFLRKIFIVGPGRFYYIFDLSVYGPAWLYLLAFGLALLVVFYYLKDNKRRFFFIMVANALVAYFLIYSLVPVLDRRYMIPIYFIIVFTVVSALAFVWKKYLVPIAALALLIILIAGLPFFSSQLKFSYRTSDKVLRQDPLVAALPGLVEPDAVILGRFAKVQRLNFATGLTMIEEPDNLKKLKDPVGFFKKHKIRYSLVDVSKILPKDMILKIEEIGEARLFKIKLD